MKDESTRPTRLSLGRIGVIGVAPQPPDLKVVLDNLMVGNVDSLWAICAVLATTRTVPVTCESAVLQWISYVSTNSSPGRR